MLYQNDLIPPLQPSPTDKIATGFFCTEAKLFLASILANRFLASPSHQFDRCANPSWTQVGIPTI